MPRSCARPFQRWRSGLADGGVHVVGIGTAPTVAINGRATRRCSVVPNGGSHSPVAADDLHVAAGRARDLPALADLISNIRAQSCDRKIRDRHRIARLHVGMLRGDDRVARRKPLRRQNRSKLAIRHVMSAMNAVRFGSYSRCSTVAGTSNSPREKSIRR